MPFSSTAAQVTAHFCKLIPEIAQEVQRCSDADMGLHADSAATDAKGTLHTGGEEASNPRWSGQRSGVRGG